MKKINLEEIFKNNFTHTECFIDYDKSGLRCILEVMKEACRQTLELAVENARVSVEPVDMYRDAYFVNKQSILNTINQVI